jgi:hypothetical protein
MGRSAYMNPEEIDSNFRLGVKAAFQQAVFCCVRSSGEERTKQEVRSVVDRKGRGLFCEERLRGS